LADDFEGLRVFDISHPQAAYEAGYCEIPGVAQSVVLSGNYAYVADGTAGLQIIEFCATEVTKTPNVEVRTTNRQPTIIRGVLEMPPSAYRSPLTACLLNLAGRKVLDLKPGANDVSRLAPGVYFISERSAVSGQRSAVRKVVLTK
jgi:hypothetical protein